MKTPHAGWRSAAYLLAWPGMDAKSFLDSKVSVARPSLSAWLKAIFTTALGVFLFSSGARILPATQPLLQGFLGMLGVALMLHFGSFRLLALFWQSQGVNAVPIMHVPLFARSLREFWGRRWNVGFRDLAHQFVFEPTRKKFGTTTGSFFVFLVSGLIHELVISLPARGGYGLPTLYFALQGVAALLERSSSGKRFNLRQGWRGRLFAITVVAGPVFLLFHPPFIFHVVIPCMKAVHVL
jgi:alginate O-acetyltransferase complex protein AlgI